MVAVYKDWLEGYCIGGPRDGIKVGAPHSWDGRVAIPRKDDQSKVKHFPGRYIWSVREDTWKWYPGVQ